MVRTKTTIYIDENLLRSARDLAARTERAEQDILEDALRRYLGLQMLEEIWSNDELPDDEAAAKFAYGELHAMRSETREIEEHSQ